MGFKLSGERDSAKDPAEQWWVDHALLLAAKMKQDGVKSFHIYPSDEGKYMFAIEPVE